ncbi:Uncharacterised protein [uncultured archaeon]|nr:Uncharacterised protein [uncultured archaeon]
MENQKLPSEAVFTCPRCNMNAWRSRPQLTARLMKEENGRRTFYCTRCGNRWSEKSPNPQPLDAHPLGLMLGGWLVLSAVFVLGLLAASLLLMLLSGILRQWPLLGAAILGLIGYAVLRAGLRWLQGGPGEKEI